MVGQQSHRLRVAPCGEILEGAHPDVARGDPRQDGAGQRCLAQHCLPGRYRGQRPGRRYAQCRHGLAHDVLAQHRAQRGTAVATAGEGRPPGALELDVAPRAVSPHHLAEQDGAPVAELRHELAELMPGIGEGDRLRTFGHAIAGQDLHTLRADQTVGIEPQALGQLGIHPHEPRRRHGRRVEPRVEALRKARIGVVEGKAHRHTIRPRDGPVPRPGASRPLSRPGGNWPGLLSSVVSGMCDGGPPDPRWPRAGHEARPAGSRGRPDDDR